MITLSTLMVGILLTRIFSLTTYRYSVFNGFIAEHESYTRQIGFPDPLSVGNHRCHVGLCLCLCCGHRSELQHIPIFPV